jgi:hypothetical protein
LQLHPTAALRSPEAGTCPASEVKLRNNRKLYVFLAILTFLIQLALFLTKTNNNLFHIRNSISLKAINAKIDSLEEHIATENQFTPHFLVNYVEKIPVKPRLSEYFGWKAGIYCMLSKDTTFIEYLNVKAHIEPYPDLTNLLKQLSVQNINIDTTPFYFALIKSFRKNANCNNGDIKKSIDIWFLLSVAWVTYSVVDYDLDKLISGMQKL